MITEIKDEYVKVERHQSIATIEFSHPQSNSLPGRLLEELTHAVHGVGNEKETRVIILRSAGEKAFCAGASFDELLAIETAEQGFAFFSGFAHLINAMRKCPQFIIARIQGKCVGGGGGIAAAADYAVAVEGAEVEFSQLAVGIGPFVVGPAVERKIRLAGSRSLVIDAPMCPNADGAQKKRAHAELP